MSIPQNISSNLLKYQKYFTKGYADAYQREDGYVVAKLNGEEMIIFPEDRLGNYFYIRGQRKASITPIKAADCGGSINLYTVTAKLVAVVDKRLCVDDLIENLSIIINLEQSARIALVSWDKEEIILDQVGGEAAQEKALQTSDNVNIVAIDFTYTYKGRVSDLCCLKDLSC